MVLYLFLSQVNLLDNPPVWPDEAYFADTAWNLLNQGRLGTDLWGGMIPGAREHLFFYPPGLFLVFGGLFKVTGLSIYAQRMLAVVVGAGFLMSFYFLSLKVLNIKKSKGIIFTVLAVLLLIVDHIFLKAVRWSRPEIFVMFFSSLAVNCLFIGEDINGKWKNYLFALSGLFLGIAILFHLMGFIYLAAIGGYFIYKHRLKVFSLAQAHYLFIPVLVIVGLWLAIIFPDINYLFVQVGLQKLYRENSPSYLLLVFESGSMYLKIYYWIMLAILPVGLVYGFIKKNSRLILITLILLFSWIYAYFGKLEAYPVLFVPFGYLMGVLFLRLSLEKGRKVPTFKILSCGGLLLLLLINMYIYQDNLKNYFEGYRNYRVFSENLKEVVPDDAKIYLSSIPDAYYIVREFSNSKVYTYPALPTTKEEYLKVLNDSDYLIYNFDPGAMFFGNYLNEYLNLNVKEVSQIGQSDEYQVLLIKLVDKGLRKAP